MSPLSLASYHDPSGKEKEKRLLNGKFEVATKKMLHNVPISIKSLVLIYMYLESGETTNVAVAVLFMFFFVQSCMKVSHGTGAV